MIPISAYYTVHKERKAVEYSVSTLRVVYPKIKIYLVSDGGFDYSYLNDENTKCVLGADTLFFNKEITDKNFVEPRFQELIKFNVNATIDRLLEAIKFCETEYIIMMDPDAIIRSPISIAEGSRLLGSRVNRGLPAGYKEVLSKVTGAKVIDCWGATPGIFHCQTFLEAVAKWKSYPNLINDLASQFYALYAHDVLLPTLFALVGEEEVFNPEVVHCSHNPSWKDSHHPIVHQFREYY